jgi:hypothetical protein
VLNMRARKEMESQERDGGPGTGAGGRGYVGVRDGGPGGEGQDGAGGERSVGEDWRFLKLGSVERCTSFCIFTMQ